MRGEVKVTPSILSVWPACLRPLLQPRRPFMLIWPTNSVQVWQTRALLSAGQTASCALCSLLSAVKPSSCWLRCPPMWKWLLLFFGEAKFRSLSNWRISSESPLLLDRVREVVSTSCCIVECPSGLQIDAEKGPKGVFIFYLELCYCCSSQELGENRLCVFFLMFSHFPQKLFHLCLEKKKNQLVVLLALDGNQEASAFRLDGFGRELLLSRAFHILLAASALCISLL